MGCTSCYNVYYSSVTTTSVLDACTGPYLFVGAISPSTSTTFLLGAIDTASVVLNHTVKNTPHYSKGVYWYLTSSYSFGFSNASNIAQQYSDVGSWETDYRLSWALDGNGGYRAGANLGLAGDSSNWKKSIYNCPGM